MTQSACSERTPKQLKAAERLLRWRVSFVHKSGAVDLVMAEKKGWSVVFKVSYNEFKANTSEFRWCLM